LLTDHARDRRGVPGSVQFDRQGRGSATRPAPQYARRDGPVRSLAAAASRWFKVIDPPGSGAARAAWGRPTGAPKSRRSKNSGPGLDPLGPCPIRASGSPRVNTTWVDRPSRRTTGRPGRIVGSPPSVPPRLQRQLRQRRGGRVSTLGLLPEMPGYLGSASVRWRLSSPGPIRRTCLPSMTTRLCP